MEGLVGHSESLATAPPPPGAAMVALVGEYGRAQHLRPMMTPRELALPPLPCPWPHTTDAKDQVREKRGKRMSIKTAVGRVQILTTHKVCPNTAENVYACCRASLRQSTSLLAMSGAKTKAFHGAIPKQNPREAIPNHDLLDAVRPLCYRAIVLSWYRIFMKQFPNKTVMKQSGDRVVVLSCYLP